MLVETADDRSPRSLPADAFFGGIVAGFLASVALTGCWMMRFAQGLGWGRGL
jgi:hypothetical protein